jgi:hypothetical protein
VGSSVEVSFLGPYVGSTGTPYTLAVCVEYCTGFIWVLPIADTLAIECHQLLQTLLDEVTARTSWDPSSSLLASVVFCTAPAFVPPPRTRLSSSDRNGSRTYEDVELLVVPSSDGLLGASEIAGARILLMADSYLQRGNLDPSCLSAMAQAACFAYNATPNPISFTHCSTAKLWYLQRPELSSLVGVPGTLVRFQTDSEHQAEDYGLYCLPAGHQASALRIRSSLPKLVRGHFG